MWISVKMQEKLFQCSNIRWITRKWFEHAACGLVFKHLPRDPLNIGINHGFQCSNIRWITRKVFEHKAAGLVFKHLPRQTPSDI